MKIRLIRRRRSSGTWILQKKSWIWGWDYIQSFSNLDLAVSGASEVLSGLDPEDVIQIIDHARIIWLITSQQEQSK